MKYKIETKITRTYDVYFEAPEHGPHSESPKHKTALMVMDKMLDHLADYNDPTMLPSVVDETRLTQKLGVKNMIVKETKTSHSVGEPESMEKEDLEIRGEVEWWDGNLNSFEIYDKLKDEYTSSQQVKLINYAKEYFHNCKDLQYQLQDIADTLGIDLEEDEDDS
jgi:hypothetical protein